MASVPNTNVFTALTPPGVAAPVEGEGAEGFANLLPALVAGGAPMIEGAAPVGAPTPQLPAAAVRPAVKGETPEIAKAPDPDAGDEDAVTDDETDPLATLIAQANFVPTVQTPAPIPAAKPAEAPVAKGPAVTLPPLTAQPNLPAPAPGAPAPAVAEAVRLAAAVAGEATPAADAPRTPKAAAKPATTARAAAPAERAPSAPALPVVEVREAAKAASAPKDAAAAPAIAAAPAPAAPAVTTLPPFTATDPAASIAPDQRAEAPQGTAPSADQSITRELDLAHDSQWLDRLARDIARTQDGDTPLRFKLHPQTLGHLKVELTQTDQGAVVRLTAETEAARAILADAQPRLAAEARAQGVRLAHTEVDLGSTGQQASGDPRRQEEARQPAFIRTARGADAEAIAPAETARTRSDRYA